jgi:hypothetical protein
MYRGMLSRWSQVKVERTVDCFQLSMQVVKIKYWLKIESAHHSQGTVLRSCGQSVPYVEIDGGGNRRLLATKVKVTRLKCTAVVRIAVICDVLLLGRLYVNAICAECVFSRDSRYVALSPKSSCRCDGLTCYCFTPCCFKQDKLCFCFVRI